MNPLQIVLIIVVAALVLGTGWTIVRRAQSNAASPPMAPEVKAMVDDARIDPGEQIASLAVEQIESMVQEKLGAYLAQSRTTLDFGTLPDGGLSIRVNDTEYTSVDDIPDATIRDAIKAAVAEFNR